MFQLMYMKTDANCCDQICSKSLQVKEHQIRIHQLNCKIRYDHKSRMEKVSWTQKAVIFLRQSMPELDNQEKDSSSTSSGIWQIHPPLNFYRCSVESILIGCIIAWFSNLNAQEDRRMQKVVDIAQ